MQVIENFELIYTILPNRNALFQAHLSKGYYVIKPISDDGIPYGEDIFDYRIFDGKSVITTENMGDYSNLIFWIPYDKTYKFLFSENNLYSFRIFKLENFTNEKVLADTIKGGLVDLTRDVYTYVSDEIKYYQIENKSDNTIHILYQNNGVDIRAMDISPYSYGYYQSLGGDNQLIVMPPYLFGNKTRILPYGDDKIRFTADVQISDLFFGWCSSFGQNLKLIAPQHILEAYKEYTAKVMQQYEEGEKDEENDGENDGEN